MQEKQLQGFINDLKSQDIGKDYCAVKCPKCGQAFTSSGGTGATKDIADLLVTHLSYPRYCLIAIEMKGQKTPWSSPQQQYGSTSRSATLWRAAKPPIESALQPLADAEDAMGICVLQKVLPRRTVPVNSPIVFGDGSIFWPNACP